MISVEERFTNFHEALKKDNPIWYDGLALVFPNKDVTVAVKKVWLIMHGEGKITKSIDWKEARNLVNKTLTWQEVRNTDGFEKAVPVEIHPKALTGEERLKRLKEWQLAVAKIGNPVTERSDPYKEVREQWKAPEGQKYHPPSAEELALMDMKVEYGRECTDRLTGKILPGMPDFETWARHKFDV